MSMEWFVLLLGYAVAFPCVVVLCGLPRGGRRNER